MLGFRNTKRDKSHFEFKNKKAICIAPVIQQNGRSLEVGIEMKKSPANAHSGNIFLTGLWVALALKARQSNLMWRWRVKPAAINTFVKPVHCTDHHPVRIEDGRKRLVTASPVMTKSWGPSWGKQLLGERKRDTAET